MNGLRLAENITAVLGRLSELQATFDRIDSDFQIVGKHLLNSLKRFDEAEHHLRAFQFQLTSLTEVETEKTLPPVEG